MKNILTALILFFCTEADAQWFTQQSGTTSPLYDIEFINDKTGWCCGEGGYIIKTTNGGIDWIRQGQGVTSRPLYGIHPVDSSTVFAAGLFRDIVKTTNGGADWILIQSGALGDGNYTCTFFINENTGWFGNFDSPEYGVRKTTNGGQTIFSVVYGTTFPEDLYFKDSLNGIGVGIDSRIHRTTNGGLNWHSFSLSGTGDFYRVSFINSYTGYTASHEHVYRTTNFGINWRIVGQVTTLPTNVTSIEFCNDNTGWAGTTNQICGTTDGGINWTVQVLTGVVYSIHSFNDRIAWTCGNVGRIWHTTNGGTSNVLGALSETSDNYKLHQNFPNPFNSSTVIKFEVRKRSRCSLNIYSSLGKLIMPLLDKDLPSGMYEITLDAGNLSSGVYFYALQNNTFAESKAMVLMK